MLISDIITLARDTELEGISSKSLTDSKLLSFIKLASIELHKRFSIRTSAEVLKISAYTNMYTLRNTDVMQIIAIYDTEGNELKEMEVQNSDDYDYKRITYNTILLNTDLSDTEIVVVYKASTPTIELDGELEIPDVMIDALLLYIAYKAHTTLKITNTESDTVLYARFEASCNKLSELGYTEVDYMLTRDVGVGGFV